MNLLLHSHLRSLQDLPQLFWNSGYGPKLLLASKAAKKLFSYSTMIVSLFSCSVFYFYSLFGVFAFECDRNLTDANILHVSSFQRRRKYWKGPIPYLGHWGRTWAFVTTFVLVLRICPSVPHTSGTQCKDPLVVNVPYLLLSRHGLYNCKLLDNCKWSMMVYTHRFCFGRFRFRFSFCFCLMFLFLFPFWTQKNAKQKPKLKRKAKRKLKQKLQKQKKKQKQKLKI